LKGRNLPILSYEEANERRDKLGTYLGKITNPEMKKFGKRVVFPVNNFVGDNFADEKVSIRDEYLRAIMTKEEKKLSQKQKERDFHTQILD
jgi:hypothetical protein